MQVTTLSPNAPWGHEELGKSAMSVRERTDRQGESTAEGPKVGGE